MKNNNFDPENKIVEKILTDTRYFVILVIFGMLMLGTVMIKCNSDASESSLELRSLKQILEFQKESTILRKGIDSTNRNMPFVVFSDKSKFYTMGKLYDTIKIGDSISKKKYSTMFYIYKDEILEFNYLDYTIKRSKQ